MSQTITKQPQGGSLKVKPLDIKGKHGMVSVTLYSARCIDCTWHSEDVGFAGVAWERLREHRAKVHGA